jgi:hypothetical protein
VTTPPLSPIDADADVWPPEELDGYVTIDGYEEDAPGGYRMRWTNAGGGPISVEHLAILGDGADDFEVDEFHVERGGIVASGTIGLRAEDRTDLRARVLDRIAYPGSPITALMRDTEREARFRRARVFVATGAPIARGADLVLYVRYVGRDRYGKPFNAFVDCVASSDLAPGSAMPRVRQVPIDLNSGDTRVVRARPTTLRFGDKIVRSTLGYPGMTMKTAPPFEAGTETDMPPQVVFTRTIRPSHGGLALGSADDAREIIVGISDESNRVVLTIERIVSRGGTFTVSAGAKPESTQWRTHIIDIRYRREGLDLAAPYFEPVRELVGIP